MTAGRPFIPWWSTTFSNGEAEAAADAVRGRLLSQGPVTREFEEQLADYLGCRHVVAVTSGSSALLLSLLALGIVHGDEVLIPNRTWVATAHAVHLCGATPVFVDTEPRLPVLDVDDLRSRVTPRTRAILPVHMNGRCVDMGPVNALAEEFGLTVIEDAAQALGSKDISGRALGTLSRAGCFSLSVAKIISTGQGGFIATDDSELDGRLRAMRTHGVENTVEPNAWVMPGFNFRFTDVLASIGLVQLRALPERIARLQEIYTRYSTGLRSIAHVAFIPMKAGEVGPYIEVLASDRAALSSFLMEKGIDTRNFYPDMDTAPYWKVGRSLDNSRIFGREGLYLPSGPSITDDEIDRVLEAVAEFGDRTTQQQPEMNEGG